MSPEKDPRSEGLGLALRPPPRSTSVAPPPRRPTAQEPPIETDDAAEPGAGGHKEPSADPATERQDEPVPTSAPPLPKEPPVEVDVDAAPRVGSRRGGSIQVATSIPYDVADALTARADTEEVTIGSVVADAIRAEAPAIITAVPPRPRRTGKTSVRQFLISPADAEELAQYLDQVPATARMTVSLLLRHCLTQYLVDR